MRNARVYQEENGRDASSLFQFIFKDIQFHSYCAFINNDCFFLDKN